MNTATITSEALSLPVQQRAELAAQLLSSLDAQKWLGLSEQHFPKDKWIPSRVSAHGNAHES